MAKKLHKVLDLSLQTFYVIITRVFRSSILQRRILLFGYRLLIQELALVFMVQTRAHQCSQVWLSGQGLPADSWHVVFLSLSLGLNLLLNVTVLLLQNLELLILIRILNHLFRSIIIDSILFYLLDFTLIDVLFLEQLLQLGMVYGRTTLGLNERK